MTFGSDKRWYQIGWALIPAAGLVSCHPADQPAETHANIAIARTADHLERVPPPDAGVDSPKPMGDFKLTFYYLIVEGETGPGTQVTSRARSRATSAASIDAGVPDDGTADDDSDGSDLAATAPAPAPDPEDAMVSIYDGKTCAVIAEVTHRYFAELALQGSGQLKDGRIVNVFGHCDCATSSCFQIAKASKWGLAGTGRPLSPYRTVAVDPKVVPLGSLLYIPALDGLRMPGPPPTGGFVHDGCVVADDTGGGVQGKQVDLFVGRRAYWLGLARRGGSHAWARHVDVFDGTGRCTRRGGEVSRSAAGSI